jgi:hypothetical protein
MKVRICIFFLSTVVLWGSLVAYRHQTLSSDIQQYMAKTANFGVAIAPKLTVAEQEPTDFPLAVPASFSLARTHRLHQKILFTSPSIHKSIKAYIVFRVFRD